MSSIKLFVRLLLFSLSHKEYNNLKESSELIFFRKRELERAKIRFLILFFFYQFFSNSGKCSATVYGWVRKTVVVLYLMKWGKRGMTSRKNVTTMKRHFPNMPGCFNAFRWSLPHTKKNEEAKQMSEARNRTLHTGSQIYVAICTSIAFSSIFLYLNRPVCPFWWKRT